MSGDQRHTPQPSYDYPSAPTRGEGAGKGEELSWVLGVVVTVCLLTVCCVLIGNKVSVYCVLL